MIKMIRKKLRNIHSYILFREALREGLMNFIKRKLIQNKILKTNAIRTAEEGPIEVRVLTWRKDYINLLWALKSFYKTAKVDYPLYIHDGGLFPEHKILLKDHFPNAYIIDKEYADNVVNSYFDKNNLQRSKEYRNSNIATVKLWDYFIMSSAERIISIDSDIVFFKSPKQIIDPQATKNYYNEDLQFAYSMSVEDINKNFHIALPPKVNSGLFNVSRDIFNASQIETWLENKELFSNKWVTEQTLHAMLSATHKDGLALLDSRYVVSTTRGIAPDTICKHYPGFFRPLFFQEGLPIFYKSSDFSSIS